MDCGCKVTEDRDRVFSIEFCPLHAAAEKLRDALQGYMDEHVRLYARWIHNCDQCNAARAALNEAKGESNETSV